MVMSTMPIKYAVPAGSARTRLLTACAARYTGCTVRGWDVWDGLDTHPASQNSGRFGYSFGKTRIVGEGRITGDDKEARDLGKIAGEDFGEAVAEILLLGVFAHVDEGQDDNRRLVGQRKRCWCCFGLDSWVLRAERR